MREYFYIDSEGIRSLLAQCVERLELETTISKSQSETASGKFGATLTAGVAWLSGGGNAEHARESTTESERATTYRNEPEHQIQELERRLRGTDQLTELEGIGDLVTLSQQKLPAIVRGRVPVRAIPQGDGRDWVSACIEDGMIRMEVDQTAISEGCSFWPHVFLGASVGKCRGLTQRPDGTAILQFSSHLGIWLQAVARSHATICLLASVSAIATDLYVKPYAMWRER